MMLGLQDSISREVVIVTKYFVPVNVVDSIAVYDLCEKLLLRFSDLRIHVVTTDLKYKSDIRLRVFQSYIVDRIVIHKVKNVFLGREKGFQKVLSELILGLRLVLYTKKLKVKTIISLSNPPLINTWNSILLWNKIYVYWSFDLYPEALFSDRIINDNGIPGKVLKYLTYFRPPSHIMALGPMQFNYLLSQYKKRNIGKIILPCGIHQNLPDCIIPKWKLDGKIVIGYVGNLGKAHSKDFLLNIIKNIGFYNDLILLVAIYGEYAEEVLTFLADYNLGGSIVVISHVNQTELTFIDIHLVSLCDNWTNVSVPSKAVSAVCAGSALWFNGSIYSDTFHFFEKCSYHTNSDEASVKNILGFINQPDLCNKKSESKRIANELIKLQDNSIDLINSIIKI